MIKYFNIKLFKHLKKASQIINLPPSERSIEKAFLMQNEALSVD